MIGPLRRRLLDLAASFVDSAEDDDQRAEREQRMAPLIGAMRQGLFRIAVMGEIKKGKSSFVNAFLGEEDLLPTDVDIATSTVYKLVHGPVEKLSVFFEPLEDGTTPPPLEIARDRLREFGTEDGNPGNEKKVDFIAVELPHPLLADGVAIVDTPGVGGLFKKHREITFRYAPHADVVLFVLDSVEAILSRDEIAFIKELRGHAPRIVFLQTKIDVAGDEQVEAWRRRNLQILAEALETSADSVPYFLVGSKLKRRADRSRDAERLKASGFPELSSFIVNRLLPRRDEILVRRWLRVLGPEIGVAGKLAVDRKTIAKEAHLPRMREYESRLAETEKDFERWRSEVWPERYSSFQDDTNLLKRNVRNRIQDRLSTDDAECVGEVALLRSSCPNVDEANERGDALLQSCAARWSAASVEILSEFRRDYVRRLQELVGTVAEDLAKISVPTLRVDPAAKRSDAPDRVAGVREALMSASLFGGAAREAATLTGIGALNAFWLGLITGPVGAAIAATAGAAYLATRIWSAHRGYRSANERQKEAAIVNLERALSKTSSMAVREATRAYEELAAELDSAVRNAIDAFRAHTKREVAARRREIEEARSRTHEEAKAAIDRCDTELERYRELNARFQDLKRQVEPQANPA